jgi:hypothetical protein
MGTERRYRTCLTVWPDSIMLVLVRDWRGHMICSNRLLFAVKPLSVTLTWLVELHSLFRERPLKTT